MESEGEIDTCNEITLDKLKSNLSDVGLPSDSEFIRVSYVMNCCKSYDEVFEYAKKVIIQTSFSLMKKAHLQFIHKDWITNISAAQYMICVVAS